MSLISNSLILLLDTASDFLFWLCFFLSGYWFVFYKGQQNVTVLVPLESEMRNFIAVLAVAFTVRHIINCLLYIFVIFTVSFIIAIHFILNFIMIIITRGKQLQFFQWCGSRHMLIYFLLIGRNREAKLLHPIQTVLLLLLSVYGDCSSLPMSGMNFRYDFLFIVITTTMNND